MQSKTNVKVKELMITEVIPIVSHIAPYVISHYNELCNKKWLKFPQG